MRDKIYSVESHIKESRQKLALVKEFVEILEDLASKYGPGKSKFDHQRLTLDLSKLVSLATLNIAPEYLNKSLTQLLDSASTDNIQIDDTNFARRLVCFFEYDVLVEMSSNRRFIEAFRETLASISKLERLNPVACDPLFVGWVDQLLTKEKCDYSQRRLKRSIDELAALTQWYTPSWIADFLTDEVFSGTNSPEKTFLDPASGAGHILLSAFQKLLSAPSKEYSKSKLEEILSERLFGLDVDQKCIELAGFSIYLATRRSGEIEELPLPNLYWFSSDLNNAGSYMLGLSQEQRQNLKLVKIGSDDVVLPYNTIPSKFDTLAFNPPYLSHRLIPREMKDFLKANYFNSHYDLYTSFIELATRLMARDGRISFICQQSFLSLQRYENFRKALLDKCHIATVAQLGTGIFATKSGEKVNSAIVTLGDGKKSTGKLLSLSKKADGHLEKTTLDYENISIIAESIPGYPIATWCPKELADKFKKLPSLSSPESGVVLTNGLFTCNNKEFVKHFREVEESELPNFVPYDKGGNQKWFATTPYLLRWIDNGDEIRRYRKERGQSAKLPGEEFYFKQGITYSYIGPSGFKARLLSQNSVFDIASSALFAADRETSIYYLLGFLNSALVKFTLGILNPTVNFQIGDLRKIPYIMPDKELKKEIGDLSRQACAIAKHFESYNIDSPSFEKPFLADYIENNKAVISIDDPEFEKVYQLIEDDIDEAKHKESSIQNRIDELIFEAYGISARLENTIKNDPWVLKSRFSQIDIPSKGKLLKAWQLNSPAGNNSMVQSDRIELQSRAAST